MIWSYAWFSSAISSTLLVGPAAPTEAGGRADGGGGAEACGSAEAGATVDAGGPVSAFGLCWPQPAAANVAASTSTDTRRSAVMRLPHQSLHSPICQGGDKSELRAPRDQCGAGASASARQPRRPPSSVFAETSRPAA